MTFTDVVEKIQSISIQEKEEIQLFLNQYIREERRESIYENFKLAKVEQQQCKLKFSSNMQELRAMLEE